jgi:hypothetical protein
LHYCLLDNHFPVLVQLPDARQLSKWLAGLLAAYWHYYRRPTAVLSKKVYQTALCG